MQQDPIVPTLVIDDTSVKRRGVCEFVEETPVLRLEGQAANSAGATLLVETACKREAGNPTLANWLVLSDLRLGRENGVELGRALLDLATSARPKPICNIF